MQFPNPIVDRLVIYGGDGNPDVQIGPNPVIIFYNGTEPQIQIGFFDGSQEPRLQISNSVGDVLLLELDSLQNTPRIFMQDHDSDVAYGELYFQYIAGGYQFVHIGVETDTGNDTWLRLQEEGDGTRCILVSEPVRAVEPGTGNATEDWHDFVPADFSNGWVNSAGAVTASYKYMPDGTVMLKGRIGSGTTAVGTVVLTMPVGWRPIQICRFAPAQGTATAGTDPAVDFAVNGQMTISRAPSAALIYLDGIRFSTI